VGSRPGPTYLLAAYTSHCQKIDIFQLQLQYPANSRERRHFRCVSLLYSVHHVHRPWHQNLGRHWRWSNGYVISARFLNVPTNINTGLGIAYVAALRAKVAVQLYDRSPEQISKGLNLMDKLLAKDVAKGKIQEADARHAREHVSVVDQSMGVRALRDVDMVIEVRRQAVWLLPVH
jgi:hypothetical protein